MPWYDYTNKWDEQEIDICRPENWNHQSTKLLSASSGLRSFVLPGSSSLFQTWLLLLESWLVWQSSALINNHNSLIKFLICHQLIILSTVLSKTQWTHFSNSSPRAVYIQSFQHCTEGDNKPEMSYSSTDVCTGCVRILTTVTGHGCRGHLVDNRPLMGRGPAQHSVSLDRLRNILLCHLPLRACGKTSIRSPILRTQVGLISTKQSERHFFNEGTWFIVAFRWSGSILKRASQFSSKGGLVLFVTQKIVSDWISSWNTLVRQNIYMQYNITVPKALILSTLVWYSSRSRLILWYIEEFKCNTKSYNCYT